VKCEVSIGQLSPPAKAGFAWIGEALSRQLLEFCQSIRINILFAVRQDVHAMDLE
jgi:hypothetical protein